MVGDFKEGMKRLANVLRDVGGEFGETAVANQQPPLLPCQTKDTLCLQVDNTVEGFRSGDDPTGLELDRGPENENLDLRLDFGASSSANAGNYSRSATVVGRHAPVNFGFFVLKGFTYSARYTSPDVEKVGDDGSFFPGDSGVGFCFSDCSFTLTLIAAGVRGGTLAGRRIPLKAFRTDGKRKDTGNDERVEAEPSQGKSTRGTFIEPCSSQPTLY